MGRDRTEALAVLGAHLRQAAQVTAYQDTCLVLCGLTLLALAPAFLARIRQASTGAYTEGERVVVER
jgi:hypothetical protein